MEAFVQERLIMVNLHFCVQLRDQYISLLERCFSVVNDPFWREMFLACSFPLPPGTSVYKHHHVLAVAEFRRQQFIALLFYGLNKLVQRAA